MDNVNETINGIGEVKAGKKICFSCKKELDDYAMFCNFCGCDLRNRIKTTFCRNCGAEVAGNFCPNCGLSKDGVLMTSSSQNEVTQNKNINSLKAPKLVFLLMAIGGVLLCAVSGIGLLVCIIGILGFAVCRMISDEDNG